MATKGTVKLFDDDPSRLLAEMQKREELWARRAAKEKGRRRVLAGRRG